MAVDRGRKRGLGGLFLVLGVRVACGRYEFAIKCFGLRTQLKANGSRVNSGEIN